MIGSDDLRKKSTVIISVCLALILSCIAIPPVTTSAEESVSVASYADEAVTPAESDFKYVLLPAGAPTRASITGYTGEATKIIIPDYLGGYPVRIITSTAFSGNSELVYIKLPTTVTTIANNAFNMCYSLEEIEISSSNTAFGTVDGVLYAKTSGKNTTLRAFPAGRSGSFTIPYGVTTIGSYAFDHCYNLTSVNMYNTVTKIDSYGFSYCWNLETIRLSDNLRTLGVKALAYCDSLKEISLPATLTSIGADAILGGIDSNDNKFYYFTDGISCTPETYAYYYVLKQGIPETVLSLNYRSITDIDTNITLIDAYSVLDLDTDYDLSVSAVDTAGISDTFPIRYNEAYAYDISIVSEGKEYTPKGNFILSFNGLAEGTVPSATKIYKQYGSSLVCVNGTPSTPFVGTQIDSGGRFVILSNNDFSLTGDIDGDGIISLYDARAALHAATDTMTLTDEQFAAADTDSDGKITTVDARTILRYAAGIVAEI